MTALEPQHLISAACEEDLATYGDSFRGAGYTKSPEEAAERYALMLDVVRETDRPLTVLDLGCGLAHLLDFMEASPLYRNLRYVGLDISPRYLARRQGEASAARVPPHGRAERRRQRSRSSTTSFSTACSTIVVPSSRAAWWRIGSS